MNKKIKVIGAGLSGCEAALQLLKRGYTVELFEMRPKRMTGAHATAEPAELVCSNSLKSEEVETASGLLKAELKALGCELITIAEGARVAAGGALAVDRSLFSKLVKDKLFSYDNLIYINEEVKEVIDETPAIIATGPLTSDSLSDYIKNITGDDGFFFFDAIAPIVSAESIDLSHAFFGGRYGRGGDDYLNLYMNKEEYDLFYENLIKAECVKLKDFEGEEVFEGCMPIEVLAKRGKDAIRYGPLRPVGLRNPETGEKYYAVVQLRKENTAGNAYNIVGFQTNLTFPEQKRVFSLIPALKNAEFLRYGVMHRNSYVNAPKVLDASFKIKAKENLFIAGQLSGVEGYVESIASGLIAALNLDAMLKQAQKIVLPETTIIGALQRYISSPHEKFQPMNANYALLPFIDTDKKKRKKEYYNRSIYDIIKFKEKLPF